MTEISDGSCGAGDSSIASQHGTASHLVVLLNGVGADADSFQDLARVLATGLPQAAFLVPDNGASTTRRVPSRDHLFNQRPCPLLRRLARGLQLDLLEPSRVFNDPV